MTRTCKDGTPDNRGTNKCSRCHKFKKWEDLYYQQHWFATFEGPDFEESYICKTCRVVGEDNMGVKIDD